MRFKCCFQMLIHARFTMQLLLLCDLAGSRGSLKLSCLRAPEVATKFETLGRVHGASCLFLTQLCSLLDPTSSSH